MKVLNIVASTTLVLTSGSSFHHQVSAAEGAQSGYYYAGHTLGTGHVIFCMYKETSNTCNA